MEALLDVGLGLDYHELRLVRTTPEWVAAGRALRAEVAATLAGDAAGVEQIGSSSVLGLLAKPIIDLAVGLSQLTELAGVRSKLEVAGWMYRGDAGDDGGRVFVLEARPWYRVAHLHVVQHGGAQWNDYLRLRDLLSSSSEARDRYEVVKLTLVQALGNDRKAYTDGKTEVVDALLRDFQ